MSPKLFGTQTTDLFKANYEAKEDVVVDQGGTSSGKTYSIDQCIFTHAYEEPGCVCTIAGQDLPNLKVGAIRDAEEIVGNSPVLKALIKNYNKSEHTYYFLNGSIIEFKAYQNAQDAKSGKRDYLFVNEANGIPYPVFQELHLRTRKKTYIDYNPNEEFWVHENLIGKPGVRLIISDHRHNPYVPDKVRKKIEALKDQDIELWKVYARGLTGKIEGLVYRNYVEVEAVPEAARLIAGGLDFGYTNDPTAHVDVYMMDNELYIDELIYETNLTNPEIADRYKEYKVTTRQEIYADCAEPKSIKEISAFNYNIWPVLKGADSIKNGIDTLKRYKINITKRSTGLRKEIKSYKWKVDANGKSLNVPVDFMNHSLDALRYVALMKLQQTTSGVYHIY